MVHIDVKKVGRIPDGGGWRAHGRGTGQAKEADRAKRKTKRASRCMRGRPGTPS